VNVDIVEEWYERTRKLSGVVYFLDVQFINLGKRAASFRTPTTFLCALKGWKKI